MYTYKKRDFLRQSYGATPIVILGMILIKYQRNVIKYYFDYYQLMFICFNYKHVNFQLDPI